MNKSIAQGTSRAEVLYSNIAERQIEGKNETLGQPTIC